MARVHAEFEQTLLTILTLNVIYMYYIDHKLIVLIIRSCQVIGVCMQTENELNTAGNGRGKTSELTVFALFSYPTSQLFYFPFASPASHRGSAVFLLITNFPVLLIHEMLFTGKGASGNIGEMLFINFIGPEPKSLAKTLTVDCIIITLQVMLLQCKWDLENLGLYILSALPVPISDTLVPVQSTDEPSDTTERENVTEEVEVLSGTT